MAESDIGDGGMPQPLKKNLGPLPVWAWGVILGALIAAYIWFGNSKSSEPESNDTGESSGKGVGDAIDGAFRIGGAWNGNYGGEGDSKDDSMDTNVAWGFRAVAALVSDGISPIAAQQAIGNYLDGEALTADQGALVDKAIRAIGQPPNRPSTPKVDTPETPKGATVKSWQRLGSGQVVAIMSDGTKVNKSLRDYIDAGMPAFSVNSYEYQTYKVKSNSETAATVAKKYGTSQENIQVLNRWKTIPNLTKGKRINVPAVKGSGK